MIELLTEETALELIAKTDIANVHPIAKDNALAYELLRAQQIGYKLVQIADLERGIQHDRFLWRQSEHTRLRELREELEKLV
jgi:hypothetical protein